ncbi:CubicO group peptidase, beta-lactamase class C family [Mucilaginibacter gossypiicola]|uniref:CubicO group peptidase, beta-lactamase class C family n=1 Tax=Mucilaginibacter gossypiicola TaxID=551995 RepID=A0A1H8JKX3_9SPHI|nr:serine hydrolase [Mucilaginibacter gossypiicola]SEN81342.1 CubicO group peptidase, beta-lactamase class C family [Mucilaginibacter gossypiicola]
MKHYLLILSIILTTACKTFAQAGNIIEPEPITSALQKANMGKVVFEADTIPLEKLQQTDLLTGYEANAANNLYMRLLLANSLTNYQYSLQPSASVEQLNQGNFQFAFYVDGRQIYQENLHKGANLPIIKNTKTTIFVPFISNRGEDSWGRFLWGRFMNHGGDEALTAGKHQLKIEVRPYVTTPDLRVGELIAQGEIKFTVPAIDPKDAQLQPIKPGSGWQVSKESFDTKKIMEMNALIAGNRFKQITSVVVIKNGKLLIEEYFNGSARDSLHNPRSVGKTFASAMMGIAIHDGYIKSVNQTLKEFYDLKKFSNYSPQKDNVTLKSLLTMSSVFDADDNKSDSPGNEENMYPTDDWVKFTLGLKTDNSKAAGKQWNYFTAGVVVLGDIINKSVPDGLDKYSANKLFKPLGISNYRWQYTPQNVPNTAGGLQMRSLDYAKFGQLYKNAGVWNGKQVLPQSWVKDSFTKHLSLPKDVVGEGYYGYLFWNKTYKVNNKAYETYYCSGNGGNKIFIFTDQPLVVIITAEAYNTPYAHSQVDKMMRDYILPAVLQ